MLRRRKRIRKEKEATPRPPPSHTFFFFSSIREMTPFYCHTMRPPPPGLASPNVQALSARAPTWGKNNGRGRMQEVLGFPRKKLEDLRAIFAATFRLAFVGCRCFFCKSMPKGSKTGAKKPRFLSLDGRPIFRQESGECVCDQVRTYTTADRAISRPLFMVTSGHGRGDP